MERKLASIQRILKIEPIPGADKIEKITLLGWEIVSRKDEFKVGDLVVYIEIDSILPEKPEFEFLREKKFRIKTIRLRKQVSQGIIFPLSILPKKDFEYLQALHPEQISHFEGKDVTVILNISKYDPQAEAENKLIESLNEFEQNRIKKYFNRLHWFRWLTNIIKDKKRESFPNFIKKTDENRINLFPNLPEQEKETKFVVREKLDGTSVTFFLLKNKKRFLGFGKKYIFGVCSRNFQLRPDNSVYWRVAKEFKIKDILEALIDNKSDFIYMQGEIIGEGVQGNKYNIEGLDFYAFNMCENSRHNNFIENVDLSLNKIKKAPFLECNWELAATMADNVKYAQGKSLLADIPREGVVIRNYTKNLSFKIINPEFLLKYEE